VVETPEEHDFSTDRHLNAPLWGRTMRNVARGIALGVLLYRSG